MRLRFDKLFIPISCTREKPAFLIWAAGFEDSAADEARLAAFRCGHNKARKE